MKNSKIVEMKADGIEHLVERAYAESGERQHLRELVVNALEAGATRIEIRPDRPATELDPPKGKRTVRSPDPKKTRTRLLVVDNGPGMTADQLASYMNTFGKSGKLIGGAHDNFGIGAKTSIMPWNHAGMVVCSWTESSPAGAMIKMVKDQGKYGLFQFEDDEGCMTSIIEPTDEFVALRPDWLTTGTMTVLLGNTGEENTFFADGSVGMTTKHLTYLNDRFWQIPEGTQVRCWNWNSDQRQGYRWISRTVTGSRDHIANDVKAQGTMLLRDGATLEWFISNVKPSDARYSGSSYIGALYKNEIYDRAVAATSKQYRRFNIGSKEARDCVSIIVTPTLLGKNGQGVYPNSARSQLMLSGGTHLPWDDWGQEFALRMPEPISKMIKDAQIEAGTDRSHENLLANISRQYGLRWAVSKFSISKDGDLKVFGSDPVDNAGTVNGKKSGAGAHGGEKQASTTVPKGIKSAKRKNVPGGHPGVELVTMRDIDENCMYAASWNPSPSPKHPNGHIDIAIDFPAVDEMVQWYVAKYPPNETNLRELGSLIPNLYGTILTTKVVHVQSLLKKGSTGSSWTAEQVEGVLTPEALTFAVMGVYAEDLVMQRHINNNPNLSNRLKDTDDLEMILAM